MSKFITDKLETNDGENGKPVSIMRKFLESGVEFKWPDQVGQCSGSHCVLNDPKIPLEWKRRISDTKRASIDVYEGGPNYVFKEAFVVKTIRGSDHISSRTRAAKEVANMKDLRHPHVAALLGTYLHSSRLSILIYPAARCDLHQFLKKTSNELKTLHGNLSDESHSPASTNSAHSASSPVLRSRGELASHNHEDYPLNLNFAESSDHLRGYFVCLSQALSYIHESDVRHKDVKPANVLIDSSGSVILTDFGISRRFAKSASHVTNDKWEWTRKYASPEIMKGKKVPRDDPSDVFSLGCVFLEMATLILGKDLDAFCTFYGKDGDAYFGNLEKVHQWIGLLEGSKQLADTSTLDASLINENVESHDFMTDIGQPMMDSLATISRMLNENPSSRPISKGLSKGFQSLSPRICDDCDERNESRWRPSIRQQQNTESGVSARRSQHRIYSPELARNQNSRLSPGSMTGEHHLRPERAPFSAVNHQTLSMRGEHHLRQQRPPFSVGNQQIPSMATHESVLLHPDSVSNSQANPNRPNSPRSIQSDPYQQIKKPNSGKTRQNRTPSEEKLLPSTEILVYDKEDKIPYITAFSALKGALQTSPTIISLTIP